MFNGSLFRRQSFFHRLCGWILPEGLDTSCPTPKNHFWPNVLRLMSGGGLNMGRLLDATKCLCNNCGMCEQAQRSLPPAIGRALQRERCGLLSWGALVGLENALKAGLQTRSGRGMGVKASKSVALAVMGFLERKRLRESKLESKRGKYRPHKTACARVNSGGFGK